MNPTQFVVGAYVEIADDQGTPQDGTLFKVIERGRKYHTVRQVNSRGGSLIGVPVGWLLADDLITARPSTLAEYSSAIWVEVERIETTTYRKSYTRGEVVEMLVEAHPGRLEEFLGMSTAVLAGVLGVVLVEGGEVADGVIADQGCSDDACDEFVVVVR